MLPSHQDYGSGPPNTLSLWSHDSPSAVNIGGPEGLQRTQCQLTPRLIYVAPSHCMQRAENPSCSPCLVLTF